MTKPTNGQIAHLLGVSERQARRLHVRGDPRVKLILRAWQAGWDAAQTERPAAPDETEIQISEGNLAEAVADMQKRFPRRRRSR